MDLAGMLQIIVPGVLSFKPFDLRVLVHYKHCYTN